MSDKTYSLPQMPSLPPGHRLLDERLGEEAARRRAARIGKWYAVDDKGCEYIVGFGVMMTNTGTPASTVSTNAWGTERTWAKDSIGWRETTTATRVAEAAAIDKGPERFDASAGRDAVIQRLYDWTRQCPDGGEWLWIWSLPGRGKTTMARRAMKRLAESSVMAEMYDAGSLRAALRLTYQQRDPDYATHKDNWNETLHALKNVRALIIDDAGVDVEGGAALDMLELWRSVLDSRSDAGLPTMFTSNKRPGDAYPDARVASRLSRCVVRELPGRDFRQGGV